MASIIRSLTPIIINITEKDNYTAPNYTGPTLFGLIQERLFKSNGNVTVLLDGTSVEQKDYLINASIYSLIILLVFVIWSLVLITLKCLGKKVGCASGILTEIPETREDDEEMYNKNLSRMKRNLMFTRLIFIFCGIGNIISSAAFVHYGVRSLNQSVNDIQRSLSIVDDNIYYALDVIEHFEVSAKTFNESKGELNKTASYVEENNYCFDNIAQMLTSYISSVINLLEDLGSNVIQKIFDVKTILENILPMTSSVSDKVDDYKWIFQVAVVLACIQIGVTCVLVVGVILAWLQNYPKPFRFIQSYLFLPFFYYWFF